MKLSKHSTKQTQGYVHKLLNNAHNNNSNKDNNNTSDDMCVHVGIKKSCQM